METSLKRQKPKESDQPLFVRPMKDGIEICLKVVPGASNSAIVGPLGDRLKVKVAAPPEHGKANQAVLKLLADWLGTKQIAMVNGHTSAHKTVYVNGLNKIPAECFSVLK